MIRNSVCIEVIVTSEESTHFDGLNNTGYLVFKESVNSQWKNRFQRVPLLTRDFLFSFTL